MIRHMVSWSLIPAEDPKARQRELQEISQRLTAMVGQAPGLLAMEVYTRPLAGSNAGLALIADFTDQAALENYQKWPPHAELAASLIRPITKERMCMDTEL